MRQVGHFNVCKKQIASLHKNNTISNLISKNLELENIKNNVRISILDLATGNQKIN